LSLFIVVDPHRFLQVWRFLFVVAYFGIFGC